MTSAAWTLCPLLTVLLVVRLLGAQQQLLPGSCNFELGTCGYTSDPEYGTWSMNEEGTAPSQALLFDINKLAILHCLRYCHLYTAWRKSSISLQSGKPACHSAYSGSSLYTNTETHEHEHILQFKKAEIKSELRKCSVLV